MTLTPQKIDSDSDCIILSDGSDIDLGVAPKKDIVVFDLKRVKTKKGVMKEETEQITFMNSNTASAREMMQKLLKKNEKGCVECPLKCGSHFKTAANMFKHVDDEVCTKDIEERTNLECSIKNCNYTCVNKSSLRAH